MGPKEEVTAVSRQEIMKAQMETVSRERKGPIQETSGKAD